MPKWLLIVSCFALAFAGVFLFPEWVSRKGVISVAGRGPAPKDPSQRARRNRDPIAMRVVVSDPVPQPVLPTLMVEADGGLVEFVWPAVTLEWWRMWGEDPLAAEFRASDWSFLADTALIHARYWLGDLRLAGELRLRLEKFGATQADRARLRITYAAADEADEKRHVSSSRSSSRASGRYGDLRLAD